MSEERHKSVVISRITRETHDTSSFVLSPQQDLGECRSGQFLTFIVRSHTGREIRRSYSLSSSPELKEPLTVTVKRIPNGEVSRLFVDRLREGDQLDTIGASGFFVLPENIDMFSSILFFAAGSGITPVFSLLKTLLHLHPNHRVVLVYSSRNAGDTIFYSQIKDLSKRFANRFELHLLFSMHADLTRSRLTPVLLENFVSNYTDAFGRMLFYVCGPNDYMRMVQYTLTSIGVPAEHIKREIFLVQKPPVIPVPPDTNAHQVRILSERGEYTFRVQYPASILQAARSLRIPLSFSCETGQCGTCVAKCLHGEVWMSRNEILLEEDLAKGKVLTCTGYPVNGDVVLSI
jgi:ferredoxin-NADP reductase